ncbi:MAG: ATP-dependent RecD-like DNA helicase [Chitinophagales bacterium]
MPGTLSGTVERQIFHNPQTNYTVLRVKLEGGGLATVVGNFPPPQAGENVAFTGDWVIHPAYGRQFHATYYELLRPSTLAGIEKYLASGVIRGIGPSTAQRLVDHFGLDTLRVMEEAPERLTEVAGIGRAKAEAIKQAFSGQKGIREVMVFLQGHGVGPGTAARIYRAYGADAIGLIRENPYRLADEVFGVGFKTADRIARALGLPKDSLARVQSGLVHLLRQFAGEGHVYAPLHELGRAAMTLLEVDGEQVLAGVAAAAERGVIVRESLRDAAEDSDGGEGWPPGEVAPEAIYFTPLHRAEREVARRLLTLARLPLAPLPVTPGQLAQAGAGEGLELAQAQRAALEAACHAGVLVVTGGPGTGKTTILKQLLRLYLASGISVALAAPTGRAAKRLAEAAGQEARTVHRLLEYTYAEGQGMRFQRNEERPLEAGAVVVDEASMLDLTLTFQLLKALRPGTRLVLVGDVDQLPAVGPGNVLRDLIDSGTVPTVRLTEVFRQAAQSSIIANAHRINAGRYPSLPPDDPEFLHVPVAEPEEGAAKVVELVTQLLPRRYGLDPLNDLQVLAPMRRGACGVENLNRLLQEALNPAAAGRAELQTGAETVFRAGDKVMQIRNNYQKGVFNGDIGRLREVDPEEGMLLVDFPGLAEGEVPYDRPDLDELVLSYAITVHKAQGSEYPAIVLPLFTQHYLMLQRNLLYTAVTRAKRLVVLVGNAKAIAMAVRNNRLERRHSRLIHRLKLGVTEPSAEPGEGLFSLNWQ